MPGRAQTPQSQRAGRGATPSTRKKRLADDGSGAGSIGTPRKPGGKRGRRGKAEATAAPNPLSDGGAMFAEDPAAQFHSVVGGGGDGEGDGDGGPHADEAEALLYPAQDTVASTLRVGGVWLVDVALLVLAAVALAAVAAVAGVVTGPLFDRIVRQRDAPGTLCSDDAATVSTALQSEHYFAAALQVFRTAPSPLTAPPEATSGEYHAASERYDAAVADTDAALQRFTQRYVDQRPAVDRSLEASANDPFRARPLRADGTRPYPEPGSLDAFEAIDTEALLRLRGAVRSGGAFADTAPRYATVGQQPAAYCARLAGLTTAPRPTDGSVLYRLGALGTAAGTVASTASVAATRVVQALPAGTTSNADVAVSLGASGRAAVQKATGTGTALGVLPTAVPAFPDAAPALATVMGAAPLTHSSGTPAFSSAKVAALREQQRVVLGRLDQLRLDATAYLDDRSLRKPLSSTVAPFVLLWVIVLAAAATTAANTAALVVSLRSRPQTQQRDTEVRALEAAVNRMRRVVAKVAALQLGVLRAAKKVKAARAEEAQLYAGLATVKELEPYLPVTVTAPPLDAPPSTTLTTGLYVRTGLHRLGSVCALRLDLTLFHRAFQQAGVKQKAVHHQLVRFLTLATETARGFTPTAFLRVHGFCATIFINACAEVHYPASRAVATALAISEKSQEAYQLRPSITAAVGDVVVGNVGCPRLKTFTAFGDLVEELQVLSGVARLHEAPVACSEDVVSMFNTERLNFTQARHRSGGQDRFFVDPSGHLLYDVVSLRPLEVLLRPERPNRERRQTRVLQELPPPPPPGGIAGFGPGDQSPEAQSLQVDVVAAGGPTSVCYEALRNATGILDTELDAWRAAFRAFVAGNSATAMASLRQYAQLHRATPSSARLEQLIAGCADRAGHAVASPYDHILLATLVSYA